MGAAVHATAAKSRENSEKGWGVVAVDVHNDYCTHELACQQVNQSTNPGKYVPMQDVYRSDHLVDRSVNQPNLKCAPLLRLSVFLVFLGHMLHRPIKSFNYFKVLKYDQLKCWNVLFKPMKTLYFCHRVKTAVSTSIITPGCTLVMSAFGATMSHGAYCK